MKTRILFSLLSLILVSFVNAKELKIESSSITFTIKNAGLTVDGSFSGLTGSIAFDADKYYTSKVDVSLPAKTIETGIDARDKHLRGEDYFDVKNYPDIKMTSRFFGKDKEEFRAYLTLTLKGKTGNITMPFTATQDGDKITIEGQFSIDRRDYGVGGYSLIMGDEVNVKVKITLSGADKSMRNLLHRSSSEKEKRPNDAGRLLEAILNKQS